MKELFQRNTLENKNFRTLKKNSTIIRQYKSLSISEYHINLDEFKLKGS